MKKSNIKNMSDVDFGETFAHAGLGIYAIRLTLKSEFKDHQVCADLDSGETFDCHDTYKVLSFKLKITGVIC